MSARPGHAQASHRPERQAPTADVLDWQSRGLCREIPADLFFPEGKGNTVGPAKQVCLRCDVRAECLEYALGAGEEFGVWGGKTSNERDRILRARGTAVVA